MAVIQKVDKLNRFVSMFDTDSGQYARTGVLDENGKDTDVDPFMTSYPELLDIGIMGHCVHAQTGLCLSGGIQCYQGGGTVCQDNMTLENFKRIIDESKGKVFQVALGGRGDPNMHENFEEILKYCRENDIVPNFTTSGLHLTPRMVALCKEYCGAVAVSWHRHSYTFSAIEALVGAGVKTNIHFVLGQNTIKDANLRLSVKGGFPKGINAIVFLLHKPIGLGEESNMLTMDDPRLQRFFHYVDDLDHPFKIGFDSCSVPGLINFTKNVDRRSIDTCEGGRWSAYITPDMKMLPCSFDNQDMRWAYDISNDTIQNAWNSTQFEDFRNYFKNSCSGCPDRASCMGGCPIRNQVVLCNRDQRDHTNGGSLLENDPFKDADRS